MTSPAAAPDLAPGLERCFLFDAREGSYDIAGIADRIPEWLRGSYFVNGPARFERAGSRCNHWLDGDGMVCALRFSDEGVRFTSRFVQTRKLRDEEISGRFLYRGFGTAFSGDRLRRNVMLEPPVNVSVFPFNGRLLALGEQTLPYELDPVTLETLGEFDFHGRLNEVSPFAAHAKVDHSGNLINFGVSFSSAKPTLTVYEFDPSGGLVRRRRHAIEHQHSVHDFGFTPRYAIFFLSPLLMHFDRFWGEGASVMESLSWEPEKGSRILVTPRDSKSPAFAVAAGNGYCLHFINCFEQGDVLNVDVLELVEPVYREYQPIPDLFATVPECRPVRYAIDLETREVRERIAMEYRKSPDFPSIDPSQAGLPYDDFWALGIEASGQHGRKFFDQLARGSWRDGGVTDLYQAPRGEYLAGEPAYFGHPTEPRTGIIIVQHLRPARDESEFLLFDAFDLRSGPVARVPLRQMLHPGFHASIARHEPTQIPE